MEKKVVSGIMLTLLLMAVSTFVFNFNLVKATPDFIVIQPDGTVYPPEAPIHRDGNLYTITDHILHTYEIVVERDNAIVDGNGYMLMGWGSEVFSIGIRAGNSLENIYVDNVTIQNMDIRAFMYGVLFDEGSTNCALIGSHIRINLAGVFIVGTPFTVMRNNIINDNDANFIVQGFSLESYTQDVDASNTVDGKPIYYLVNRRDMAVPSNAGFVALINCVNITVEGLELKDNGNGILIAYTNTSKIVNNKITNNEEAVFLRSSLNNIISGNNIINNLRYGLDLHTSSNNNIISGNTLENNGDGIRLVHSSRNNTISENIITDNLGDGVYLNEAFNNKFYHNNFINNSQQVNIATPGYANFWDNDYPSGGNYWDDYDGTDKNKDGIGDKPYEIDALNIDRYPLMSPHGQAVGGIVISVDKFGLLIPYVGLASTITVATASYVKRVKRRKEKQ